MIESPVEVEAAKGVPYRRPMLRDVQLSSEVYSSYGGEGLRCNVLYRLRSLNFQYSDRVKPLEILTSLWFCPFGHGGVAVSFQLSIRVSIAAGQAAYIDA
jgi:hypothetical protein